MLPHNIINVKNTEVEHDLLNWIFETSAFWDAKNKCIVGYVTCLLLVLTQFFTWEFGSIFEILKLRYLENPVTYELHLNCIFLLLISSFKWAHFQDILTFFNFLYCAYLNYRVCPVRGRRSPKPERKNCKGGIYRVRTVVGRNRAEKGF